LELRADADLGAGVARQDAAAVDPHVVSGERPHQTRPVGIDVRLGHHRAQRAARPARDRRAAVPHVAPTATISPVGHAKSAWTTANIEAQYRG